MAGIKVAVFGHSEVFVTGTAAGQTLGHAGAVRKIHIEMEEEKASAFAVALHISVGELIVFFADAGQVFLGKAQRAVLQNHRFHREDIKAFIIHGEHVFCEVHVVLRVGAAQVSVDTAVIPVAALAGVKALVEVLDGSVVGTVAAHVRTHGIVDFLAAVEGQHEGEVVVVEPFDVFIIQKQAVGRQRQLELLARFLFALAGVFGHGLDGLHVDEGFPAEEIHFEVLARAAALN